MRKKTAPRKAKLT